MRNADGQRLWKVALFALTGFVTLGVSGCADVDPAPRGVKQSPLNCVAARPYHEVGISSWYGRPHHGQPTASGQIFDMNGLTAAHRRLPFGSKIRVTNIRNGRSVLLTVNDRGPFVKGRILDVSYRAARELSFTQAGLARVRVEAVGAC